MTDANFTPEFDPADVDGDYGSTGGDITVPVFHELKPFKFWCQKALPLVYDDSLSYYEVLCKVVNYLNNMMGDLTTGTGAITQFAQQFVINQQFLNNMATKLGQNTEELESYINDRMEDFTTAYNELQDYVNAYFNNLDVQDEIDNKLDEMAESGQFNVLFDPVIQAWMEEETEYINSNIATQNSTLAQQNGRISVLEGRMDTFASLPSGSTSGNAELLDIRTNFLGETFGSAGDAVRASDYIASGFSAQPFVDEVFSSGTANYAFFDTTNYKGGKYAIILNSFNNTLLTAQNLVVNDNPSFITGDPIALYADSDETIGHAHVSDYLNDYVETITETYSDGYRLLITFSIPQDSTYIYIGLKYYLSLSESITPHLIGYASNWINAPVDPTLSIEGDAADAKATGDAVTQLNERIGVLSKYGAGDLCPVLSGTYYPGTLTFIGDGKGNYTVSGTNSSGSNIHANIYNQSNDFPDGIKAGDKICVKLDSTNTNIRLYVMAYNNGAWDETFYLTSGYVYYQIPGTATGFRLRFTFPNGTVCDNDKLTPYVFVDKTKHEYNGEISLNTTDIATLKSFMPYDYIRMDVTATDGLVNKWNQVAGTTGYAYIKQSVSEGEKYKISGWFYGGNYPAYLLLNGDSVASFHNESTTGAFNNLEVAIPANVTHIVINGYVDNPASISKYGMVKAGSENSRDSVVVGVGSTYVYNNINTAITANTGSIIDVDYGTYETEIQNLATNKTVIGKDVDLCILRGTNKDYDTPPIEIAGGIIKNFTVLMANNESASHKGYCLHSDNANCANNKLIVENCKFNCEGQHTIGMGIYPSEEVVYKNCEFVFADEEDMPTHAAFFAHNSGASDGIATVKFHNCIFRGSGYTLKLSSYSSNCTMQFEFIDCTFESDTLTGDEMVWTDYVTGDTHDQSNLHRFKGKMPLLKTSHGNNVSIANYTA